MALRGGWQAHRSAAAAVLGLTVLGAVGPIAVAWSAKLLFDELSRGGSARAEVALTLAAVAAGIGAVSVVISLLAGYANLVSQRAIVQAVEERLYARVSAFTGLRYFEDPAVHDRLRLAEQGAQQAPQSVALFAMSVVRGAIGVGSFAGVLLLIWPPMALVLIVAALPEVYVQLRLGRRMTQDAEGSMRYQRARFLFRQLLTDPRAAGELRLFGLSKLFHGRMLSALREVSAVELRTQRRATLAHSGLAGFSAIAGGVGTVVAVLGVVSGRLTLGDVMLFLAAVSTVQNGLSTVAGQVAETREALRLYGHYLGVLEAPDDLVSYGTRAATPLRSGIVLRDVWFRYGPADPWVLRGVDLTIARGQVVGLVGVNGAGKSTLVKLLCRFYDPEQGQILWDGVDLREIDPALLRQRIGATFQRYMTYDLTAAENIGIGWTPHLADRAAIRAAGRAAEIDDKLAALPRGYDTLLSRTFLDDESGQGVELSGGQWQRVALARSLMRADADLLILDEPSSGLDAEGEYRIHQTLRGHRAGRTSLLISHRLSALRDADLIAVIADGRVAELGKHDSLMAADGVYTRLFSLQASGYQDQRVPVRGA